MPLLCAYTLTIVIVKFEQRMRCGNFYMTENLYTAAFMQYMSQRYGTLYTCIHFTVLKILYIRICMYDTIYLETYKSLYNILGVFVIIFFRYKYRLKGKCACH